MKERLLKIEKLKKEKDAVILAHYKYAEQSVKEKQRERYLALTDEYYNFISEYPESKYRKELDGMFNKAQAETKTNQ